MYDSHHRYKRDGHALGAVVAVESVVEDLPAKPAHFLVLEGQLIAVVDDLSD